MSGASRPDGASCTLCHRTRLWALLIASCMLLVVMMRPQSGLAPTGSLHRGPPLRELWASRLPEQAWFSGPQCRQLVTRFTRDGCLPLVYLASFPRSGNTWTRYLLETSSGVFTTSAGPTYRRYRNLSHNSFRHTEDQIWKMAQGNGELVGMGYRGEGVSWTQGNTIAAKTHFRPEPWNKVEAESISQRMSPFPANVTRRAVLIVRDPFKSFISLQKYGKTKSLLNAEDMRELYLGKKWEKFVIAYAQIWYDLNARWIEATNETHVIAYERLTQDPIGELTKLLHFMNIEPDPRRMGCVRLHLEGKAHNRQHGVIPDSETYPLRLRATLWSRIHQLNSLLKDRGHQTLPLERYSFTEEFSDIYIGV